MCIPEDVIWQTTIRSNDKTSRFFPTLPQEQDSTFSQFNPPTTFYMACVKGVSDIPALLLKWTGLHSEASNQAHTLDRTVYYPDCYWSLIRYGDLSCEVEKKQLE